MLFEHRPRDSELYVNQIICQLFMPDKIAVKKINTN